MDGTLFDGILASVSAPMFGRALDGGAFTFTFDPDSVTIVFRNQPEITWVLDSSSG